MPNFNQKLGKARTWLTTDDAVKYTSQIIMEMPAAMNIEHVPTIAHNRKENGISEQIPLTIMNAIRAAPKSARLDCVNWVYAPVDVVDKHKRIPHSSTGKEPQGK